MLIASFPPSAAPMVLQPERSQSVTAPFDGILAAEPPAEATNAHKLMHL